MPLSSFSKAIKIFFSYAFSAPKDKRLFDQLTTCLAALKRQQLIDEWYDSAISADSNITQLIEAHMSTVDIIVLLISADFFASERCYDLEMKRALELSAAGAVRLIPVLLSPVAGPIAPLDQYSPLPSNGKPVSLWRKRDVALNEVAKGIRRVVEEIASRATHIPTLPGRAAPAKRSLYAIPYRHNIFFTDRETILATLSSSFTSIQPPQTPILALNGLGGIGKTQIALAYSYSSTHLYQAILWLNASSREVLSTEVSSLADQLSLPQKDRQDEQHLFATLKRWLQNQTAWLLVLDQIEDVTLVDLIVPTQSSGHVLLTTRTQALGNFASAVPIAPMDTNASVTFLLQRARLISAEASIDQVPAEIVQAATAIAQEMDGLPLALDQAGAYLEETGCSLTTYLALYHQERATLLGQRGQLAGSHPDSVMITLSLAIEKVTQKHPANLDLLRQFAFLHPDAIPDELLIHGAFTLNEPLQSLANQPLALHQALADLRCFSLIHHSADTTTLRIHRIVQAVLTDTLTAEQRHQWADQTVRLVNSVFPEVRFDTWAACERYLLQAQHCATLITDFHLTLPEAAQLLQRLGFYCYRQACYTEAETYLTRALSLHEQHQWADAIGTAQTLNSLGLLYYRQARYQEAEAHHQRALALREQQCGPDDPQTAESLHNLALLYGNHGQYTQAEQLYQRVLAIEERTLGPENPETARTLNNLGLIYYMQGNYRQAEAAYQQALTIYEHSLPANHPDLMYPMNGLGAIYEKRGQYQQAEELYQRALAICEQAFGDEHPETAHSLNKLADIYETQGKYQQAEALYRRALIIGEQALGPDHPDIALFLNNLAFLANEQGQYQQAEPLYQRALSIYEQILGPEHPVVASVLNNLGQLYRNSKDEERAEAFLRRALAIRQHALGPTHPDTAQSLNNLAELLSDQHIYEEAESLFKQALAIRLQVFGPEHPEVVYAREKYVSLLERMNRSEEAATLRQTARLPEKQPPEELHQDDH
jgi:tetratricopeptide (TPR) repeat protein